MTTVAPVEVESKIKSISTNLQATNEQILLIQRQLSQARGNAERYTIQAKEGQCSPTALAEAMASLGSLERELSELTTRREELHREQSEIVRIEAEAAHRKAEDAYEEALMEYVAGCADLLPIANRIRELSIAAGRHFAVQYQSPQLIGPTILVGGVVLHLPEKKEKGHETASI